MDFLDALAAGHVPPPPPSPPSDSPATVARLADAELRSVNAEIEVLLREALTRRGVKVERSQPARRGRPPVSSNGGGNDA